MGELVFTTSTAPGIALETFSVSCREPQAEGGSGIICLIEPYSAAEGLRGPPGDVQGEPQSAVRSSGPVVHLVEAVEDPLAVGFGDPVAAVAERHTDTASVGLRRDGDGSVGRRVLQGVVKEVRDDAPDVLLVRPHRGYRGREAENDPAGFQLLQSILGHSFYQSGQSNRTQASAGALRLDPGCEEQVLDEGAQPLAGTVCPREELLAFSFLHDVASAAHRLDVTLNAR